MGPEPVRATSVPAEGAEPHHGPALAQCGLQMQLPTLAREADDARRVLQPHLVLVEPGTPWLDLPGTTAGINPGGPGLVHRADDAHLRPGRVGTVGGFPPVRQVGLPRQPRRGGKIETGLRGVLRPESGSRAGPLRGVLRHGGHDLCEGVALEAGGHGCIESRQGR